MGQKDAPEEEPRQISRRGPGLDKLEGRKDQCVSCAQVILHTQHWQHQDNGGASQQERPLRFRPWTTISLLSLERGEPMSFQPREGAHNRPLDPAGRTIPPKSNLVSQEFIWLI